MLELMLKTISSSIIEAIKFTTESAMMRVQTVMSEVRTEVREMVSDSLYSAQMMLLETIIIGFLFVIGLFYLGGGLTEIVDWYSRVPGVGSTLFGILFLLIGYLLLSKSKKRIKQIKEE